MLELFPPFERGGGKLHEPGERGATEGVKADVVIKRAVAERREKLEQLRALEAGMRIDVTLVDSVPLGVDTPEDLDRARAILAASPR